MGPRFCSKLAMLRYHYPSHKGPDVLLHSVGQALGIPFARCLNLPFKKVQKYVIISMIAGFSTEWSKTCRAADISWGKSS